MLHILMTGFCGFLALLALSGYHRHAADHFGAGIAFMVLGILQSCMAVYHAAQIK